jgi:hypothetical protein
MPEDANNPGGSADDSQVRWNLYLEQERLARQNIRDSTSDFDKNLLALSSGALGISLAFIKDIVPLEQAMWLTLLYWSWFLFALCILATVSSFRFSIIAHVAHIGYLKKFILDSDDGYKDKQSWATKAVDVCTWTAGAGFFAGVALTLVFCYGNVERIHTMKNEKRSVVTDGQKPSSMTPMPANQGTTQKEVTPDLQRGKKPSQMTPIPPVSKPEPAKPAQSGEPKK